ncbi:cytochrome c biogenesis protein DipZ, partial [Candidatus Roizmanbacteria bacterium]|nr:cytochrome c biogenesis protein DipZ [Candidatus Roizmanbacteria bacterium]
LFAFISGLVTILAPCIWPLLPIILSSTTSGGKAKPLGITLGIITSFALFTLTISYIVKIIPFDPNVLRLFAVVVIGFLGLTLVIPKLTELLEGWVSQISGKFAGLTQSKDQAMPAGRHGFRGGIVTGLALGIVWSPCAGPILATIATLAATQSVNLGIIVVTIVYVVGVGIPLFIFATVGSKIFSQSRVLSPYTGVIQKFFGIVMILTALAIFTNYDKVLQAKLLDLFPSYANFLIKLESNPAVKDQLNILKGKKKMPSEGPMNKSIIMVTPSSSLPNLGKAPEFVGIERWLNVDKPLTIQELRGKVILIDFWTYTCINCIRTLPFVTSWYEKYKDKGFIVIGVHTPEFEFEKKTSNVEMAIMQYKIHYPVAQDNDYETWDVYNNHYWPAKYLVDANGNIRYTHFGEGEYDVTEKNIQTLLKEAGQNVEEDIVELPDQTPRIRLTPETYLGTLRMERLSSSSPPPLHYFALDKNWKTEKEYSSSGKNSALELSFYANQVHLVIVPKTVTDRVKVILDGEGVDSENAGKDVVDGYIQFDEEHPNNLYTLIDLKSNPGEHTLRLEFESESTKIYAFTFG